MLEAAVETRLKYKLAALNLRIQTAADMTEMVRQKALPQASTIFVIPTGLRATGGHSAAGMVTAGLDEVIALVLVLRKSGDATGARGLDALSATVLACLEALTGWAPDQIDQESHPVVGDFRPLNGSTIKLDAGVIFYQLEFACEWQLRISP